MLPQCFCRMSQKIHDGFIDPKGHAEYTAAEPGRIAPTPTMAPLTAYNNDFPIMSSSYAAWCAAYSSGSINLQLQNLFSIQLSG